jgi:hypothetical protein
MYEVRSSDFPFPFDIPPTRMLVLLMDKLYFRKTPLTE